MGNGIASRVAPGSAFNPYFGRDYAPEPEDPKKPFQGPDPGTASRAFTGSVGTADFRLPYPAGTDAQKQAPAVAQTDLGAGNDGADDKRLPDVTPIAEAGGASAMFAGGGAGVGVPKLELEKFSLDPTLEAASKRALLSTENVGKELQKFQQSDERAKLLEGDIERQKAATVAEERRAGRMADLEPERQKVLEGAKKLEGFKVDQNRLFGQGQQRFATQLSLGVASILSNIGEALQGKAATNAVLGIVRDAIARDVEIQEGDYRRQLQGLEARRTALGDLAKQIGDERGAADALAKQQAEFSAMQLKKLSRGLADAEARNVIEQAAAQIEQGIAKERQAIGVANTQAENQKRTALAQMALSASQSNASLAQQREMARAQAAAMAGAMPENERKVADDILKVASEKRFLERDKLLGEMREHFANHPESLKALTSLATAFQQKVGRDEDAGVTARFIAANLQGGKTPQERRTVDLMRRYAAIKESGQGGKAITGIEDYLFKPEQVTDLASALNMVNKERGGLLDERNQLFRRFGAGSTPGKNFLITSLRGFVPDSEAPAAPNLPAQPGMRQ